VQHLEGAVAQVDEVAVGEHPRGRAGGHRVVGEVHPFGHRRQQLAVLGQAVAGVVHQAERLGAPPLRAERAADGCAVLQRLGLGLVDPALVQLVQTAGVVVVVVRRHPDHPPAPEDLGQVDQQAAQAEAGVHQHVGVTAAHQPDVAAQERVDVGFGDPGEPVVDGFAGEPLPARHHRRGAH
jgi:hypothetical protein